MQQPLPLRAHPQAIPHFYVTPRHRFSAGALLLAIVLAGCALVATIYTLSHARHNAAPYGAGLFRRGASSNDDEDDDPSQVDTIYLGDPGEAPVAKRPGGRASFVHPFVVVHLPRSGDQTGQIPNSAAGRLLYDWLAAFNNGNFPALGKALPSAEAGLASDAQRELRERTGGFTLLSAKEIQPGVLVFRLHDQTTAANETLGTLRVRSDAIPPAIANFSLRAVAASRD